MQRGLGRWVFVVGLLAGCGSAAKTMEVSSGGGAIPGPTATAVPDGTASPDTTAHDSLKLGDKKEEARLRVDLELDGKPKDRPDKLLQTDSAKPPLDGKKPGGTETKGDDLAEDTPNDATPAAATGERLGGNVDPASVRSTLSGAREIFRRCSDSDIKLELDLTITPSGDVMEASASSSAPDDVRVRDCVVSALRKLRFQPFGGSEAARISLGLALRR